MNGTSDPPGATTRTAYPKLLQPVALGLLLLALISPARPATAAEVGETILTSLNPDPATLPTLELRPFLGTFVVQASFPDGQVFDACCYERAGWDNVRAIRADQQGRVGFDLVALRQKARDWFPNIEKLKDDRVPE